jgi:hypothetical protein
MPPLIDLIGREFGRLKVIKRTCNDKFGHSMWLCVCSCGKEKIIVNYSLINGTTKSCGCWNIEKTVRRSIKHGHKRIEKVSKIYRAWESMIKRCTNYNDNGYKNYGSRGITVCQRWRKFSNFLEDMGEPPTSKHSIDRIDNDGNYCAQNCRWATRKERNRNTRNNHLILFNNKEQCLAEWAEETGISSATILWRLSNGWSVERSLITPVRKKKKRKSK